MQQQQQVSINFLSDSLQCFEAAALPGYYGITRKLLPIRKRIHVFCNRFQWVHDETLYDFFWHAAAAIGTAAAAGATAYYGITRKLLSVSIMKLQQQTDN